MWLVTIVFYSARIEEQRKVTGLHRHVSWQFLYHFSSLEGANRKGTSNTEVSINRF